jgi:hypothetical protein
MQLTLISALLRAHGLEYPQLAVLQSNESPYSALLVQPTARIKVRDDSIGNSDRLTSHAMFGAIARVAFDSAVDLLVTPEYSFPWDTLFELLEEGTAPRQGQLWVLGCESLTLAQLSDLKGKFAPSVVVLHEDLPEAQPTTARYVDPVAYVFRTKMSHSGLPQLAMVVQFKTCPSGDARNTEATRMARGNSVYLFEKGSEVRLMTIVCSDAFALTDELVDETYENLLLLHLQLNEKPRHEDYMRYRRRLYSFACDRTELICLNWAENITLDLADQAEFSFGTNISASAWHSKSDSFATDDAHVEHNHAFGMYYTRDRDQKRHMLHFTYRPSAFLLHATKVRHHAVAAARSRRLGPTVARVLTWTNGVNEWLDANHPADDGFVKMTTDYGAPATVLNVSHSTSPLAVERLACITSGDFGPSSTWYEPAMLPTAQLEPRTEVVLRLTVAQDPDGASSRQEHLRTIKAFAGIAAEDLPVPTRLKDLRTGYRFDWTAQEPHCNVHSSQTQLAATLIYAGESPSMDQLQRLHAKASALTFRRETGDRLCVIYREGGEVRRFDPPRSRSIFQATQYPGRDFTEPSK